MAIATKCTCGYSITGVCTSSVKECRQLRKENTQLPKEVADQIFQQGQDMLAFAPDNKWSYIKGATAYATKWFPCFEENGKLATTIADNIDKIKVLEYDNKKLKGEVEGLKEAHEDHQRLVRHLDILINGDAAAEQASLCDLVNQIGSFGLPAVKNKNYKGLVWVKAETPPPAKRWHGKVRTVNRLGELNERNASWFPGWEVEGPCDEYVSEWLDESAATFTPELLQVIRDAEKSKEDDLKAVKEVIGGPAGREDWISVEERLPEESGRYWCYMKDINDLGTSYFQWNCAYNANEKRFSDSTLFNGEQVTHWRKLPEPPKQQKEK